MFELRLNGCRFLGVEDPGPQPRLSGRQLAQLSSMADPLFLPFRALGYITDEVPFAVLRRGKETTVTVSVGKAWQVCNEVTYTCQSLRSRLESLPDANTW